MTLSKPYFRTARIFLDGKYGDLSQRAYITDRRYSKTPSHYIRAYMILLRDLQDLFEYIEPADKNLGAFSYRIHELLVRACVELEANFKAIFNENQYRKKSPKNWKIHDYKKIDKSHFLSSYQVRLPFWRGKKQTRKPFLRWKKDKSLVWYQNYNNSKHDRQESFENATFSDLLDAMAGLVIVLSAQFLDEDFSPGPGSWELTGGPAEGFEYAIGSYFAVKYPSNILVKDRYDFNWECLKQQSNPFQQFDYDQV